MRAYMLLRYGEAQLGVVDIDFFGLYDCFPICFIRAIEAVNVRKNDISSIDNALNVSIRTGFHFYNIATIVT